jgi:hypothetical protein
MKCKEGNTAVHFAFMKKNFEIILMLIDCGGNLNELNDLKNTPLAFGDTTILKKLNLDKGVCQLNSNQKVTLFITNFY